VKLQQVADFYKPGTIETFNTLPPECKPGYPETAHPPTLRTYACPTTGGVRCVLLLFVFYQRLTPPGPLATVIPYWRSWLFTSKTKDNKHYFHDFKQLCAVASKYNSRYLIKTTQLLMVRSL
jgi:hypothetical protein